MKKNLEVIRNNKADSMLGMQDEDARKLLAGRNRLLALNAIFDAAAAGESARTIAKSIHDSSSEIANDFSSHFRDVKNTTEH